MKIIACYSSKGGVGKTSTSVNLAYASASSGNRTLLIDLDQQGASTFYFRVRPPETRRAKDLIRALIKSRNHAREAIRETDYENLYLLPANRAYRHFDTLLKGMKKSKHQLANFVSEVGEGFDRIILDCPPTMSLLAENVFRTADLILVPVVPTTLSERTFEQLKEFFERSGYKKKRLRPFFSMVEQRKRIHGDTMDRMRQAEKRMLDAFIPYSAEVEAMGTHRAPLLAFSPRHPASEAFTRLWHEVDAL